MKLVLFTVAFLTIPLNSRGVEDKPKEDGKKELEKIQGTWTFESHEFNGAKMAADDLKVLTIIFDGDKYTVKQNDTVVQSGTHKLDPAKNPKLMDITISEGQGKGSTHIGIYALDGDTLKACVDTSGKKRPTEFASASGSGQLNVVLKKLKK